MNTLGGIIVARLLSPSEYGIYHVTLVLPNLLLLFSDWGINPALTRFIALYKSKGDTNSVREIERSGIFFKLIVGGSLSLFLFLFADFLTDAFLGKPEVGGLVKVASLIILFESLTSTFSNTLSGLDRLDYRGVVRASQGVINGLCSPLLVYLGYNVSGAIIGSVVSYIVSSGVGFLLTTKSNPNFVSKEEMNLRLMDGLRMMLRFGVPIFIGVIVGGFSGQLQGILVSWFLTFEVIGNYRVAERFLGIVGLFNSSITTTLLPTFSKISYANEQKKARDIFRNSVRYSAFTVIPLSALLATISRPAINLIFTAKYPEAPLFFSLLLIPTMYVGIGALSIEDFFNSQGDTGTTMKIRVVGTVSFLVCSPLLIWKFGAVGLIISTIIQSTVINLHRLIELKRKYDLYPDIRHTIKILVCSGVSAGLAYAAMNFILSSKPIFNLLIGT
ncbi:MAG: oligosaccharide flippase family protein, partial [Candidatus Hodarchaeota archaeon]